MPASHRSGALVISLDFELHWGVRDHTPPVGAGAEALLASRPTVTQLARLFGERDIRATWATVGLLFSSTKEEADALTPALRPAYHPAALDPYGEPFGPSEDADPLHLAGSLVDQLVRTPGQEIGSHTFSNFYCLEDGASRDAFRSDLDAAQTAAARSGLRLRSLVLPRNQWRPDLASTVLAAGFECYRGPQPGWANRPRRGADIGLAVRAARLASTYAGPALPTVDWQDVLEPSGLCNVPASAFLRPLSPQTRGLQWRQVSRIVNAMREAAGRGRILHLWWHPQNFVANPIANMHLLEQLFEEFQRLRASDGMQSLSMGDVSDAARRHCTSFKRVR
jgi:hypothetical protein